MGKENAPPSVIKRLLNTVNTNKTNPYDQSAEATSTSKISTTMATPLPDKKRLEESWKAVEEIINRQQQQHSTPAWKIQATPPTTSPPLPRSSPSGKSTPGSIKKALAVSFPTSHRVTRSCSEESFAPSIIWMKQMAGIYDATSCTPSSSSPSSNGRKRGDPNTNDSQCDTCEVVATTTPVTTTSTTTTTSITTSATTTASKEDAPLVASVDDAPMNATILSPAPPAAARVVVVRSNTNVATTTTTPLPSRPPVVPSPTVLKRKQQQQKQKQQCTYTSNTPGLQLPQKLVTYTLKLCIMLLTVWMVIITMTTTHPTLGMPFSSSSKTHPIADVIRNSVPQGLKKIDVLNSKGIFKNSSPYYHQFQQQMWRPWEKNSILVDDGVVEPPPEHSFVPSSVSTHLKKVWSSSSAPSSFAYETEQGVKIGFNPGGNNKYDDDSVSMVAEKVEKREIVSSSWGNSRLALSEFHIHVQEVIVAALKKVFKTVGQKLKLASVGQH